MNMAASEIAFRIKSKLLRRRHSSGAPSFGSSRSGLSSADGQSRSHSKTPSRHREPSSLSASSQAQQSGNETPNSVLVVTPNSKSEEAHGDKKEKESEAIRNDTAGGVKPQEDGKSESQLADGGSVANEEGDSDDSHQQATQGTDATVASTTITTQSQGLAGTKLDPLHQDQEDLHSVSSSHPQPNQPQLHSSHTQPSLRPAHSVSRLHSIDEGLAPISPTSQGDRDSFVANSRKHDVNDHQPHSITQAALPRENRPAQLELSIVTNSPVQSEHSNFNTPAGAAPVFNPNGPIRRQSLVSHRQSSFIKTLLSGPATNDADDIGIDLAAVMVQTRKIWVKRPHASPTLVTINEDDLVDDVRDMILRKYANSLGRTFDSPDLTLRICARDEHQKDRLLGPEEPMVRTIDQAYPGGQTVDEAIVIDIPRRTPRPSPRPTGIYVTEDGRPPEAGDGYFPPIGGLPSPHHQVAVPATTNGAGPHSIAVLGTGHIPPIPSPGGTRRPHHRSDRPRVGRTHTSATPGIIANGVHPQGRTATADPAPHGMQQYARRPSHSRAHSNSSEHKGLAQPAIPPMPTSPVTQSSQTRVSTPPPRVSSPRPSANRKKTKKPNEFSGAPGIQGIQGILSSGVPPISVLIVEDNPINLKLLEAFVKRLKVRWQTAMNGRDAVKKWRTGGFHLVLMDIQLPVMNGLEATREIRRLERLNSIGVFSSSPGSIQEESSDEGETGELKEQDRLENMTLFKSPVIIVALTASSLQSDRHEALAAGCNDFLTKPVNFVWLERKVMEWGCMQALIDFDGWRQWKDFSQEQEKEASKNASIGKAKPKKKSSLSSST